MKEGLIESRVRPPPDLTLRVKEFVHQQAHTHASPFQPVPSAPPSRAKRSLTDWRQLYQHPRKIMPQRTDLYRPNTTQQCFRRNICSQSQARTPVRPFLTRQTRRDKFYDTRRDREKDPEERRGSMLEFAVAQDVYENRVRGTALQEDGRAYREGSNRERRASCWRLLHDRKKEYLRVGEELEGGREEEGKIVDATEQYIQRASKDFRHQIRECNRVKIRDSHKIDNSRFLDNCRLLRSRRKSQENTQGLRYYSRA